MQDQKVICSTAVKHASRSEYVLKCEIGIRLCVAELECDSMVVCVHTYTYYTCVYSAIRGVPWENPYYMYSMNSILTRPIPIIMQYQGQYGNTGNQDIKMINNHYFKQD